MIEWKDTTTYSQSQLNRIPTMFSARCGPVHLVVTSGHMNYPGKWVAHGFPLFERKVLKASTREEAQAEAVQMARDWLNAAQAGLGDDGRPTDSEGSPTVTASDGTRKVLEMERKWALLGEQK
jgi:hypothetical protein